MERDATEVSCRRCERRAEQAPATWSSETVEGRRTWLCERCTRDNLRGIEGKLDDAWW